MLKLNVKPLFAARGIDKPNGFLRKHGFTADTASRVVTGKVRVLNLDRLEKLCLILNCKPEDLLEWEPSANFGDANKYELSGLMRSKKVVVLSNELKGLPLAKIEEVYSFIEEKKREVGG
jgi:DNA-binding Xre family transcriptional regulator